jgi:hypothetical protein
MTEDQIKHMVNRFLGWRLPENFSPDNVISFNPIAGEHGPHPFRRTPSGTNLFDAMQADAMVRYMVEGLPAPASGNAQEAVTSTERPDCLLKHSPACALSHTERQGGDDEA